MDLEAWVAMEVQRIFGCVLKIKDNQNPLEMVDVWKQIKFFSFFLAIFHRYPNEMYNYNRVDRRDLIRSKEIKFHETKSAESKP